MSKINTLIEDFSTSNLIAFIRDSIPTFKPDDDDLDHFSGCCGEFKINSWVDSQNSFGAMIRTKYSCTIYYTDDDKVGIKDLKFDE